MSSLSVGGLLVPGPLVRVDPAGYFLAEVQASRSSLLVTPMYITNKILQNLQSRNLHIFTKICCNMNRRGSTGGSEQGDRPPNCPEHPIECAILIRYLWHIHLIFWISTPPSTLFENSPFPSTFSGGKIYDFLKFPPPRRQFFEFAPPPADVSWIRSWTWTVWFV